MNFAMNKTYRLGLLSRKESNFLLISIAYIFISLFIIASFSVARAEGSSTSEFELEREHYEEDDNKLQEDKGAKTNLYAPKALDNSAQKPLILRTPREIKLTTEVKPTGQKQDASLNDEDYEREDYSHETDSRPIKELAGVSKTGASSQMNDNDNDNILSGFYLRFGGGFQNGLSSHRLPPFNINDFPKHFPLNADLSNTPNEAWFKVFSADPDVDIVNTTYPSTYDAISNKESSRILGASLGYSLNDYIDLEVSTDSYNYSYLSTVPLAMALKNEFATLPSGGYWGMSVQLQRSYSIDVGNYMLGANFKIPLDKHIKPFIIGGFGFAKVKESQNTFVNKIEACNQWGTQILHGCTIDLANGSDQQTRNYFANNTTMTKRLPIYQVGVGLEYDFNKNFAADLRYRYTRSTGKTPMTNLTLQNHNFTIGLKYKF